MATRKAAARSKTAKKKPALKQLYAKLRKEFTAADVVKYTEIEKGIPLEQVIAEMTAAKVWDDPIVTEVTKLTEFYPAEDYHRDYYQRNPAQPYCQMVIAPKVAKSRKHFLDKLNRSGKS